MPMSDMQGKERKDQPPPAGYPTEATATKKSCCPRPSTKKGDRGFIEGCLAALCCCWLCEVCF